MIKKCMKLTAVMAFAMASVFLLSCEQKNAQQASVQSSTESKETEKYQEESLITREDLEQKSYVNVVEDFFDAFSREDYETMKSYCTDNFAETLIHENNVWGMRRAELKELPVGTEEAVKIVDGQLWVFAEVEMETVKESALYPDTEGGYYVVLDKTADGWIIDSLTTG